MNAPAQCLSAKAPRRRARHALGATLLSCALLAPQVSRAELPPDCQELGPALVGHSCFHAEFGPYATVQATAGTTATAETPDVDPVHTLFEVILPAPLGENTITYRVASKDRAGAWAIFSEPSVPIRVLDPQGNELTPLLAQDIEPCGPLQRAQVYHFEDVRYRLVLGPAPVDRGPLVIENVQDFVTFNGRDLDGDGHGDPSDTVVTMCVPPPGYVSNDGDCDDMDPAVHPGALELCDGVDSNCNGVPDDVGLPCSTGVGLCKTSGKLACGPSGAPALCSASAGSPSTETCDGLDEDCDGVPDGDEAGLCSEFADTPRCISAQGAHLCGCARDEDCGDAASGRICDPGQRRCVNGCVDQPGRNGCPVGLVCSSPDPANPGVCQPEGGGCTNDDHCPGDQICDVAEAQCVDAAQATRVDAGCGCRVGEMSSADAPTWLLVGIAALLLRIRRHVARSRGRRPAALLSAALLLGGCGSRVEVVDGRRAEDACVPRLGDPILEHACNHVMFGDLQEVVAGEVADAALPDVDEIHTAFRVVLQPEGDRHGGVVSYRPARDGEHALLMSPKVAVSVTRGEAALPLTVTQIEPEAACEALEAAVVVDLAEDEIYVLRFGPSEAAEVVLFIEHLGTFADDAWAERCSAAD
ncbi:putative metal-binding motif-containing protein [Polyangium sp. 15x6]|uniref:putative metal-binding motif-containing protein n=1 Tax=Polyangium sp. 15x6 TaxID=3042687 RepID=UPI002499EB58|nr:putative metal-binding motif-containing protein [Polyangium sp. 15x6]MDI3290264.1 putative metal-binding motif-containing protein [Polyangium sp. 15x6]